MSVFSWLGNSIALTATSLDISIVNQSLDTGVPVKGFDYMNADIEPIFTYLPGS